MLPFKILRKKFKDPRIHFAINCASKSCPVLPGKLFDEETLEETLEFLTRNFINDDQHVYFDSIDKTTGILYLNPIFKWYKKDFPDGIVNFSQKPYFHWFEVISRITAGFIFVFFNKSTLYPQLILSIGCLLIAVGFGLLITGPVKHRKFAVWSAYKFKSTFRPAGVGSFIFGSFLIYISTIGVISN